jgi:hypothetical protein
MRGYQPVPLKGWEEEEDGKERKAKRRKMKGKFLGKWENQLYKREVYEKRTR